MHLGEIKFEEIDWQGTPHPGVFVSCLEEGERDYLSVPRFTSHAVRIDPGHEIGPHYHERGPNWTELLLFPRGGEFTFYRDRRPIEYSGNSPVYERIRPGEIYSIVNRDASPLYFFSNMHPGFTGFREIVEV